MSRTENYAFDITFHPGWWNKHTDICFTEEFFKDPEKRINSDIIMRRVLFEKFGKWGLGEENPKPRPILGSDLIASGFLYSEMLGCKVRYSEENPPEVLCAHIDDEDALNFLAPSLEESSIWRNIEHQIQWMKEKYGYVESAVNLQGILNLALDLRGESIFIDLYMNEKIAHNILEQCYNLSVAIGKRLAGVSSTLSGGVTAIVKKLPFEKIYVNSNCSVEMVSGSCYQDFLMKYDQLLSKAFQPYGIHHCGQSMEHVAEEYAQVLNLSFAEVGAGSDIRAVRKAFPKIHLNLRYSPVKLAEISEKELQIELKQMYEQSGGDECKTSISCVGIDSLTSDSQVEMFLKLCSTIQSQQEMKSE